MIAYIGLWELKPTYLPDGREMLPGEFKGATIHRSMQELRTKAHHAYRLIEHYVLECSDAWYQHLLAKTQQGFIPKTLTDSLLQEIKQRAEAYQQVIQMNEDYRRMADTVHAAAFASILVNNPEKGRIEALEKATDIREQFEMALKEWDEEAARLPID